LRALGCRDLIGVTSIKQVDSDSRLHTIDVVRTGFDDVRKPVR